MITNEDLAIAKRYSADMIASMVSRGVGAPACEERDASLDRPEVRAVLQRLHGLGADEMRVASEYLELRFASEAEFRAFWAPLVEGLLGARS